VESESLGNDLKTFAVSDRDRFGFEGVAQRLRHNLGIAKIAHGKTSALANEKGQTLALLTRSLWQRRPEAA
jgi:hypothetical protein